MNKSIVVIANDETKTFFTSNNHCQEHGLDGYVPTTHYLPSIVKPRPSLLNGVINSEADVITVFYSDYQQIDNPDKNSILQNEILVRHRAGK